jgi:hypothetical protein
MQFDQTTVTRKVISGRRIVLNIAVRPVKDERELFLGPSIWLGLFLQYPLHALIDGAASKFIKQMSTKPSTLLSKP